MRLAVVAKLAIGDEHGPRRRGRLDSRANFVPMGHPVSAAVIPRSSGAILVVVTRLLAFTLIQANSIQVAVCDHKIGTREGWLENSQMAVDKRAAGQIWVTDIAENGGQEIWSTRFCEPPTRCAHRCDRNCQPYRTIHGRSPCAARTVSGDHICGWAKKYTRWFFLGLMGVPAPN